MNKDQNTPRPLQVGDRVKYTGGEGVWIERELINGDEGVVSGEGFYDDCVFVEFGTSEEIDVASLERIEPYDRKREFLERLQSLLREFDASICDYEDYMVLVNIGDEQIRYKVKDYGVGITPDNVFDYDEII